MTEHYTSSSVLETQEIARKIASRIQKGDIFLVHGSLGAGKSVLIRAIMNALGIHEDIPSPTFTLVNEYHGIFRIYHFDLYRLHDPYELYEIGFEEYIYSDSVSFIEWPDKAGSLQPEDGIVITITIRNNERDIEVLWKDCTA